MHTNMQDDGLDQEYVQRCRNVWWTVYILDRQMSTSMGVPVGLRDEDISASFPTFSMSSPKGLALELNVKLSGILSQIMNSKSRGLCRHGLILLIAVYGTEGRLNRKFIYSTKKALKATADITDQLNRSFALPATRSATGISRLSAHLHLLHHQVGTGAPLIHVRRLTKLYQCVVLAIRPLLFSLLKKRLDKPDDVDSLISPSSSTRALLHMGIESAQHIVAVLERLKAQSLLGR
jgi:proline utilization trans-activator